MSVNGYTRQSAASIVTGLVVAAGPVNNEFNAIQTAMDATIGHAHDGTVGGGQMLNMGTVAQANTYLPLANGGTGGNLSAATSGASITMGPATSLVYIKNNFAGTVAPTNLNDSTQGYQISSIWVDQTSGISYMCTSAVVSTATWVSLSDPVGLVAALNKILVDSTDTTPGQLNAKLSASTLLTQSVLNSGGNESISLKTTGYTATGTNTYAITPSPAIAAYAANQAFFVTFTNANTGPTTINVNGLGPKALTKNGNQALAPGDITAGYNELILYDGIEFQISPSSVPINMSAINAMAIVFASGLALSP